jgi:hypothetical protein
MLVGRLCVSQVWVVVYVQSERERVGRGFRAGDRDWEVHDRCEI